MRAAVRGLLRSPSVSIGAILVVAVGIGANGTVFSYVNASLLRAPSGITAPDRIARVERFTGGNDGSGPQTVEALRYDEFAALSRRLGAGTHVAAYATEYAPLGNVDTASVNAELVTGSYFSVLGVTPGAGVVFAGVDTLPELRSNVLVLSARVAVARFGSIQSALGKQLWIGGDDRTVIGVMPKSFYGLGSKPADAWIPVNALVATLGPSWDGAEGLPDLQMVIRLPPHSSMRDVQQQLRAGLGAGTDDRLGATGIVLRGIDRAAPTLEVVREANTAVRLSVVAALLLVMACANVAGLLFVRGTTQRRAYAVRIAMGASRWQIFEHVVVEAVILGLAGGAVGCISVVWTGEFLRNALQSDVHWISGPLTPSVGAFICIVTLLTAVGAAIAPALRASHVAPQLALKDSEPSTRRNSRGVRQWLVSGQIALSAWILAVAGLFLASLHRMRTADLGFDATHLEYVITTLDSAHRDLAPALTAGLDRLTPRLRLLPEVASVALASNPMTVGAALVESASLTGAQWNMSVVSPGYFETAGIHVLEGRGFDARDGPGGAPVAIVGATTARLLWPGQSAIGRCLHLTGPEQVCRIVVGVAHDIRDGPLLLDRALQAYIPRGQAPPSMWSNVRVVLRLRDPRRGPSEKALASIYSDVFGTWVHPSTVSLGQLLGDQLNPWRIRSDLFTAMGFLAVIVTVIGVFSTVSFAVGERMHEFGVRRALGAGAWDIVGLVVRDSIRPIAYGVEAGLCAALMSGPLLASNLYGVSAHDPVTLVGVAIIVFVVGGIAAVVPVIRALGADPKGALASE